jgi:hypothetical protein
MKAELKRICELQPSYSDSNTPEMQERGAILRGPLKVAVEELRPMLAPALGRFGADFQVDASDGIGRKTELPWVRFCSKEMSPKPTEGFYCVVHFSTGGDAVHITVGCGSSRFFNGYSVVLPAPELARQTAWARSVIVQTLGTIDPFVDPPEFGATRALPISFQRATAISKRIAYEAIDATDIDGLLLEAAGRLRLVYEAQSTGRDLTPADQAQSEIAEIVSPARSGGRRQGYGLPAPARRAVEHHAMLMAQAWLRAQGYEVKDCSSNMPFDYLATRNNETIKVEVKGTTSDRADAILMTSNEVELHRLECGRTALIIVSGILLSGAGADYLTSGGEVEALIGWDIAGWSMQATTYRVTRRGSV